MNDERILAAVESKRADALGTHRFVHEHPELSHEEHECSRHIVNTLEQAGIEVDVGVAGMKTAFRATDRSSPCIPAATTRSRAAWSRPRSRSPTFATRCRAG